MYTCRMKKYLTFLAVYALGLMLGVGLVWLLTVIMFGE